MGCDYDGSLPEEGLVRKEIKGHVIASGARTAQRSRGNQSPLQGANSAKYEIRRGHVVLGMW